MSDTRVPPGDETIRDARHGDAAAIAAIFNESIAAGDSTMEERLQTEGDILGWMAHFSHREQLVVLEEDGGITGWGIIKRYSERNGYRFTCETSVYLRRALAGKRSGRGTRLQVALLERCRELGYHHVVAKIWAENEVSLRLHYKLGFEPVGVQREVGFSRGAWRDVAILQYVIQP